jgi:hypothetical protein
LEALVLRGDPPLETCEPGEPVVVCLHRVVLGLRDVRLMREQEAEPLDESVDRGSIAGA